MLPSVRIFGRKYIPHFFDHDKTMLIKLSKQTKALLQTSFSAVQIKYENGLRKWKLFRLNRMNRLAHVETVKLF